MECPPPRSRALALASVRKAKSGVSQPMRVMVLTATGQSLKSINRRCELQSAAGNSESLMVYDKWSHVSARSLFFFQVPFACSLELARNRY